MRSSLISSTASVALALAAALPLACLSRVTPRQAALSAHALANLQLPFVENRGQVDPRVAFYAPTFAGTVFVTRDGALTLSLRDGGSLVEQPVGRHGRPQGLDPMATRVSIFTDRASERSLATFQSVAVPSPWQGIALSYRAHGDNVERLFRVAPGADAGAILMRVRGAETLAERDGALVAHTGRGDVTLTAPVAYQMLEGVRHAVPVSYRIHGDEYGFALGIHDPRAAVVIDPLLEGSYLSGTRQGSGQEEASATSIALGPNGDLYLAGGTNATTFPGTSGGAVSAAPANAWSSVFVARMSSDLTQVKQATYYGISGMTVASPTVLAINPTLGNVYVLGSFFCNTGCGSLPGGASGADTTRNALTDPFVAEFDPTLTQVLGATYAGGSKSDYVTGLALGPAGTVYVAGSTTSSDIGATAGGAQSTVGATVSAFVTEFSADLKSYLQSTYLGDGIVQANFDNGQVALAVAPGGDIYVSGTTGMAAFPGVAGGAQSSLVGADDEFVTRLSGDLKTIKQSTYLGDGQEQQVSSLLAAPWGDVYATTQSADASFTAITGGALATDEPRPTFYANNPNTCVVTRLSGDLTAARQSTFVGGSTAAVCMGAALDAQGYLYEAGTATTRQSGITDPFGFAGGIEPMFSSLQSSGTGFLIKISPDLTHFVQGTYFGGSMADGVNTIIAGLSGDIYAAGGSQSDDVYGMDGFQQNPAPGGSWAAYVGHFSDDLTAGPVQLQMVAKLSTANDPGALTVAMTVNNTGKLQPATGVTLTFHLAAGVKVKSAPGCTVKGSTITCVSSGILMPGSSVPTDLEFTSVTGTGAGTVDISADQKLATGSTASIQLSVSSGSGGGGGTGGTTSGGGGSFSLLVLLGMAGFAARRRNK